MNTYTRQHLDETIKIINGLEENAIEKMADVLADVRVRGGRLFFLGVGGSAGNASHAVNDFRKIAGIETYAPTDNVSELTARTNDEGWDTVFSEWLKTSRLNSKDAIFILSVGGGNLKNNISPNLVKALQFAKTVNASILGIVGRDGGYTKKKGDLVLVIPTISKDRITPHSEEFQGIIWHCLTCHPSLTKNKNKWEGLLLK